MKFDCIVGNPPYQEDNDNNGRKSPIYNYFMDLAFECANKVVLISPARFLSNSGQTPATWNKKMLEDEHFNVMHHWPDSAEVFPNNDIKGGVAITCHDNEKEIGPIGTFIPFEELQSIHDKVIAKSEKSLEPLISAQGIYRFSDNAISDFPEIQKIAGEGTGAKITSRVVSLADDVFSKSEKDGWVKFLYLEANDGNNRAYKWIKKDNLQSNEYLDTYNVLVPESNGSGALGEVLSTPLIGLPLIGLPLIGHSDTFIAVGKFDNKYEAEACLKYVKTKFARCMLGILKTTQHNGRSTWAKVPLQDFTPQSDIDWTAPIANIDRQLYAKYALDSHEVEFIEEKVRGME